MVAAAAAGDPASGRRTAIVCGTGGGGSTAIRPQTSMAFDRDSARDDGADGARSGNDRPSGLAPRSREEAAAAAAANVG